MNIRSCPVVKVHHQMPPRASVRKRVCRFPGTTLPQSSARRHRRWNHKLHHLGALPLRKRESVECFYVPPHTNQWIAGEQAFQKKASLGFGSIATVPWTPLPQGHQVKVRINKPRPLLWVGRRPPLGLGCPLLNSCENLFIAPRTPSRLLSIIKFLVLNPPTEGISVPPPQ